MVSFNTGVSIGILLAKERSDVNERRRGIIVESLLDSVLNKPLMSSFRRPRGISYTQYSFVIMKGNEVSKTNEMVYSSHARTATIPRLTGMSRSDTLLVTAFD